MRCRTQITFKDNWRPCIDSLKGCMISNAPADHKFLFRVQIGIQNPFNRDSATSLEEFMFFARGPATIKGLKSPTRHVWEPRPTRLDELAVSGNLSLELMATRWILVWATPWLNDPLVRRLEDQVSTWFIQSKTNWIQNDQKRMINAINSLCNNQNRLIKSSNRLIKTNRDQWINRGLI